MRSQTCRSEIASGINEQTTPKKETFQQQSNLLRAQFIRAKLPKKHKYRSTFNRHQKEQ